MCPVSINSPSVSPTWEHIKAGILGLLEDSPVSTEPCIATLVPLPFSESASQQFLASEIPPGLGPLDFSIPPGFNPLPRQESPLQESEELQVETHQQRETSRAARLRTPPGFTSADLASHGTTIRICFPNDSTPQTLHVARKTRFAVDRMATEAVVGKIRPTAGKPHASQCITQKVPFCTRNVTLEHHTNVSAQPTNATSKRKARSVLTEVSTQVLNVDSDKDLHLEHLSQVYNENKYIQIDSFCENREPVQGYFGRKHARLEPAEIPPEPSSKRARLLDAKTQSKRQNARRVRWTDVEDSTLLEQLELLGSQWALIATKLPGRSADAVRLRWRRALSHQHQAIAL